MRDTDILFSGNLLILFVNLFINQYLVDTKGSWLAYLIPAIIFIENTLIIYRKEKEKDDDN